MANEALVASALVVVVSLAVTAVVTAMLIPFLKRIKVSQEINELAPGTHSIKSGTPTMGGTAILCGLTAGCAATHIMFSYSGSLFLMLGLTLVTGAVGILDDMRKITKRKNLGLRARNKFILQLAVGLACAVYAVNVANRGTSIILPFAWKSVDIGIWIYPYIVFIFVAMVNAVNLTDGLDGLASSTSCVAAIFFPVLVTVGLGINIVQGEAGPSIPQVPVSYLMFPAIVGSCLGFLIFNRYPAKIFMGDTGSLTLGAALAVGGIFTHMELLLPIVGLIFVIEALSVVIQVGSYKLRNGKRVFKMAPLHHHFELSGWHEKKVVNVFMTATLVICLLCAVILVLQVRGIGLSDAAINEMILS